MRTGYDLTMENANRDESRFLPPQTWVKIKEEYIGKKASMRELSRKYGVAVSCISNHAKKEGWKQLQEQIDLKSEQKIIEAVADKRATNTAKAMDILDKLLQKIEEGVNKVNPRDVSAMKSLVGSMKDLKELGVFETEQKDQTVIVRFEGGEEYAD